MDIPNRSIVYLSLVGLSRDLCTHYAEQPAHFDLTTKKGWEALRSESNPAPIEKEILDCQDCIQECKDGNIRAINDS